ncbi:OPA1 [Lepeophtheirus salmonis]|uniref:dynamin GTPase n=1 Tax=Lepeophtheirus salmonis TaxID=72036 RepID=A0A7R8D572_LEPSM|nr:OPA1 [Lepeophtheirus salmonis]CAF3033455.1 OPA1 [Lepeophtheirus salmonis]
MIIHIKTGDSLPRVVVIGDQSAGKTSVLEMIAQARIFPRGAGEMMTRAPVSVTLSEGPYHIARFKDSSREFDLNNAKDLQDLRNEVEKRMLNSVQFGPGLQRMVLVDLPASNYMSNPNAIILCIQDASVDAERIDLAEKNNINPERIERILSGKLFPMKALGYFAVVTGKGSINESIQDIKRHEDEYFSHSKLFKNSISPSQTTTRNLSYAVSDRFWKMVHDTIEQQADAFKATRFNLETEWKNNFPRMRELDRNELFEKARGDILDEVVNLSLVPAPTQSRFSESSSTISQKNSKGIFNTTVDIRLKQWADTNLGNICVEVGWESAVVSEAIKRHRWEVKASDALRLIQLNTLEDNTVHDKEQWDSSIRFLESALNEKLKIVQDQLHEQIGPSYFERLLHWKSSTEAHGVNTKIISELQKLFHKTQHTPQLSNEEISIVKRNLMNDGIEANDVMIKNVWNPLFRKHLLEKAVQRCGDCKKGFFAYSKGISTEYDCSDVVLFWRVQQMLKITANNLRQQVINRESKRFERVIKEVLEEFSQSSEQKKSLLSGRRVQLVEELKNLGSDNHFSYKVAIPTNLVVTFYFNSGYIISRKYEESKLASHSPLRPKMLKSPKWNLIPIFVARIIPKLDWNEVCRAADQLGQLGDLNQDLVQDYETNNEFLKKAHRLLLEIEVINGDLVCPETGRKFPITDGIPNMLLNEDEV